jgi:hypothetical protein
MAARSGKNVAPARARRAGAVTKTASTHAAPAGEPEHDEAASGARALIRAGLKALGDVPGDVVARQARIFELLLGIGQSPAWTPPSDPVERPSRADPFGKFEDVFDQRVARSLQRLGMPSPLALKELTEQVRELNELLRAAPAAKRRKR